MMMMIVAIRAQACDSVFWFDNPEAILRQFRGFDSVICY